MLKLKQAVTHKMKIRDGRSNPAMQVLHWPTSPDVSDNPKSYIDCDVTTYVTQDSLIVPVEYLRILVRGDVHLNSMIDILVKDQETLEGLIEFTGKRKHYH